MITNIAEYLERSAAAFPDKVAFSDSNREITFSTLRGEARRTASALISAGVRRKPIAIYLKKSVECIAAFLGCAYAGNFYSPLDVEMPDERVSKILATLCPPVIITDRAHVDQISPLAGKSRLFLYEDLMDTPADEDKVTASLGLTVDTDVAYVFFTSGSTGTPKGVTISQKSLIDFTEWGAEQFSLDSSVIFGNQTPLYFSMSVFDVYETLRNGGTMHIIPREHFGLAGELMQYLYDRNVNTLYWVPSALTIVSTFNLFESPRVTTLKNILFSGEVMPVKHLNRWMKAYPDCRYANLYGPTEVTDCCTFYEVDRHFEDSDVLPMGRACRNMDVFLLDEKSRIVPRGETGEVCVRGTGLAYGYYRNDKRTREVFVQNPLNAKYPEVVYRTGDLAYINDHDEFVFVSRKDFQIKHMGHRIELGEIEAAVSSIEGVDENCCLYDTVKSRIVLFYTGSMDEQPLMDRLKTKVPEYMIPNRRHRLDSMPHNLNGKIDRQKLKAMI